MSEGAISKPVTQGLRPWHKKLIWACAALAGMGTAYLVGRLQTSSKIDAAEARSTEDSAELESAQATARRLEARRQLHLMLLSLDQRNFGIAKQHQEKAARLLEQSAPDPGSELSKLVGEIRAFPVHATENLATQQKRVLELVARFDEALPPPP